MIPKFHSRLLTHWKILHAPVDAGHILNWLFDHVVFIYITFILLFPKIPIYYVASFATPIRIDDLVTIGMLVITVILGWYLKRDLKPKYHKIIGVIGVFIGALVISTTIGSLLNMINPYAGFMFVAREVEYLIPLYVGLVTITSLVQAKRLLYWLIILIFPIAFYTFLQLFGIVGGYGGGFYSYEYVEVNDRVFAAFSGPYEIGAYYVLMLSIVATIASLAQDKRVRNISLWVFGVGLISLSYVNARIPILALLVAIVVTALFTKKWKITLGFSIVIIFVPLIISPIMLYRTNQLFSEVNNRVLKNVPYFKDEGFQSLVSSYIDDSARRSDGFKQFTSGGYLKYFTFGGGPDLAIGPTVIPTLKAIPTKASVSTTPKVVVSTIPQLTNIPQPSEIPTSTPTSTPTPLPTLSPTPMPVSGLIIDQRYAYDDASLSFRLNSVWPLAIDAWKKNPLVGGGMSIMGVGVDSEFITLLAETGIAGLVIFAYLLLTILRSTKKASKSSEKPEIRIFLLAIYAGVIGLIIEGLFVDVFRASKIAYLFWLLVALVLVYSRAQKSVQNSDQIDAENLP